MIEQKYTKKDGTEGVSYKLEQGDIFTPLFDEVNIRSGKYGNMYSLRVKFENGVEGYVQLTKSQGIQMQKIESLSTKQFVCYSYDTQFRKGCVGIRAL